jgi:hypothetical protein
VSKMPNTDFTNREAKDAVSAASRNIEELFRKVKKRRGPRRAQAIYRLLSEVRLAADLWRKETTISKRLLKRYLNQLAGGNFKAKRTPELVLLRSAISDRQVYSAWAKVAGLARRHRVPPNETEEWIMEHGGIDTIIRERVGAKK